MICSNVIAAPKQTQSATRMARKPAQTVLNLIYQANSSED